MGIIRFSSADDFLKKKKTVLIVEDEPELREIIVEKLEGFGYQVHQAANGEEGLICAQKVNPDVIVSDVVMPKKDGNKFLKELRQSDFGKDIPFIVLTARVAMRDYFEVMGVDTFLEKPFKIEDLVAQIEAVIQKRTGSEKPGKLESDGNRSVPPGGTKDEIIVIPEMTINPPGMTVTSAAPRKESPQPRYSQKKNILILENDMEACYELQRLFSEMGNTLYVVSTPQECIEEANRINPDLIILRDLFIKIDAKELANQLRTIPRFQKTPIIIYTNIGETVADVNSSGTKTMTFVLDQGGEELLKKAREILGT